MVNVLLLIILFLKSCALTLCLRWGAGELRSFITAEWILTLYSGILWGAFAGLTLGLTHCDIRTSCLRAEASIVCEASDVFSESNHSCDPPSLL